MDALKNATDKPLIIINESMQFSAGVNLTYVMEFIKNKDIKSAISFYGNCIYSDYLKKLIN